MYKIFVDGHEGTTGLQIHERLASRADLELLHIPAAERKNPQARAERLNAADVVFLCLPDAAARESVALITAPHVRVIDASTAHRTAPGWCYGLPELRPEQREQIRVASRVAVPGCHATGFVLLCAPLVAHGLLPRDYPVTCHSITGYSGGGKKLIRSYEEANVRQPALHCPRHYALGLNHKHLPEMQHHTGLASPPLFTPVVGDFYQGMAVVVPLHCRLLQGGATSAHAVHQFLVHYYRHEPFVRVMPLGGEAALDDGFFNPLGCNQTNRLDLFVFGHAEQVLLVARLDNLGKGASAAAVQNMNLMLGMPETTGLSYEESKRNKG